MKKKANYAYLVSDGMKIKLVYKKPKDVRLTKAKWYVRSLNWYIGETITVHTDGTWIGTIGVYNLSIPKHLQEMVKAVRDHTLKLAAVRIKHKLHTNFGSEASRDVMDYRLSQDQGRYRLKPIGERLFGAEEIVNAVCFQEP